MLEIGCIILLTHPLGLPHYHFDSLYFPINAKYGTVSVSRNLSNLFQLHVYPHFFLDKENLHHQKICQAKTLMSFVESSYIMFLVVRGPWHHPYVSVI